MMCFINEARELESPRDFHLFLLRSVFGGAAFFPQIQTDCRWDKDGFSQLRALLQKRSSTEK